MHSVTEFLKVLEADLVGEEKVIVQHLEAAVASLFVELFHHASSNLSPEQQQVVKEKVTTPLTTQFVDPVTPAATPTVTDTPSDDKEGE